MLTCVKILQEGCKGGRVYLHEGERERGVKVGERKRESRGQDEDVNCHGVLQQLYNHAEEDSVHGLPVGV